MKLIIVVKFDWLPQNLVGENLAADQQHFTEVTGGFSIRQGI